MSKITLIREADVIYCENQIKVYKTPFSNWFSDGFKYTIEYKTKSISGFVLDNLLEEARADLNLNY